ncbi:MAG: hypothetical protein HY808_16625 [Nitrospirae bacterium]|nr:hypothetical protein [Nitrospirota bacterium]
MLTKPTINIAISIFISLLFIWGFCYFLCDSLISYEFDETLDKQIHKPGLIYKHRSEGWGTTYIGEHGIIGVKDITKDPRKKVVIWGDSHVEAFQVDDDKKLPQVISSLQGEKADNALMAFGVGMSGDSVADYYFDIPKYEKLAPPIIAHFIIISSIDDILPDQSADRIRGVFNSNPYRLENNNWKPRHQNIKRLLNNLGLYFVWDLVKSFNSNMVMHFKPATRNAYSNKARADISEGPNKVEEAISFLMKKLRAQTVLPIIIVYCPYIPTITEGKIVSVDQGAFSIKLLAQKALQNNIVFLDMTDSFINAFNTTGKLPRGFPNSWPGYGHFNVMGHQIIALEISTYIQRNMTY